MPTVIGAASTLTLAIWAGMVGHSSQVLSPSWWSQTGMPLLGIGGTILGLAWILRVTRGPEDPDPPSWRYREGP